MHNKKGVESVIVDSLINILKRQIRHEEKNQSYYKCR